MRQCKMKMGTVYHVFLVFLDIPWCWNIMKYFQQLPQQSPMYARASRISIRNNLLIPSSAGLAPDSFSTKMRSSKSRISSSVLRTNKFTSSKAGARKCPVRSEPRRSSIHSFPRKHIDEYNDFHAFSMLMFVHKRVAFSGVASDFFTIATGYRLGQ